MKSLHVLAALLALALLLPAPPQAWAFGLVYNRYNIHIYDNGYDIRASYANWTDPGPGHAIIPPNTPMTVEKWYRGFILRTEAPRRTIYFLYDTGRMRLSIPDYVKAITSPTPVSLTHLTPVDLEGVSQGRALVGMTREGVLTALGFPAQHRTPSLDAPEWTYWKNRFATLAVVFGQDGLVAHIRH